MHTGRNQIKMTEKNPFGCPGGSTCVHNAGDVTRVGFDDFVSLSFTQLAKLIISDNPDIRPGISNVLDNTFISFLVIDHVF